MNYHPGPPRRPGRTTCQGLVLAAIRPGGVHEMIAAVPDDTLFEFDLIHVDEHATEINHSGSPNTNLTTITYHVQIGGSSASSASEACNGA